MILFVLGINLLSFFIQISLRMLSVISKFYLKEKMSYSILYNVFQTLVIYLKFVLKY